MTYGAETWTLTKQAQNKLAAAQTKMERSMLNITYKDRRTSIWIRERTKLIDIIYTVRKMKWSWAGHINMAEDSTRQGNLETTCWGLRPTTGHNGCLMMMMMMNVLSLLLNYSVLNILFTKWLRHVRAYNTCIWYTFATFSPWKDNSLKNFNKSFLKKKIQILAKTLLLVVHVDVYRSTYPQYWTLYCGRVQHILQYPPLVYYVIIPSQSE